MLELGLSNDYRKNELFGQLLISLDQQFSISDDSPQIPFPEWVKAIDLDGKPFSYDHHDYLIDVYKDNHPDQTFLKGTQLGLTSYAMLRSIYGCRYHGYRNVLYYFPSKTDVTEFSKGRVAPLIAENPDTIGKWIKETDSANIKQIWQAFLYLRGMKSVVGMKSVPGDFVVYDELDEAPQTSVDKIYERMAHSLFKESLKLSNPTLPDYGIDAAFQLTDQQFFLLKCSKCGKYTDMVETFPDCLVEYKGHVIRLCQHCRDRELDISKGKWVAKRPRIIDKRGRQFTQLWSYYVDPAEILHKFKTTNNLTDFYNLKIGIAYVEAENRLSREQVLALCGNDGISSHNSGPCFMGVDQGNELHVVIGKKHPSFDGQIVHLGIYKEWEELDGLMKQFNILRCVVDALPETRNARGFSKKHPGKIFLNYYNERQKGSYAWNEGEMIVSCNRTESLDSSHKEINDQSIILPKQCGIVEKFASHMHNTAKKLEEDEETGSKRYIYVKLGEDHFRHAFNYECMARQNAPNLLFPEDA